MVAATGPLAPECLSPALYGPSQRLAGAPAYLFSQVPGSRGLESSRGGRVAGQRQQGGREEAKEIASLMRKKLSRGHPGTPEHLYSAARGLLSTVDT